MQGRKPLPNNVKRLKNTDRKCRMNLLEPEPDSDDIEPPVKLSRVAKKHWARTLQQLRDAKIATNLDSAALAVYCEAFATWVDAMDRVRKEGAVIETERGLFQSPYLKVADNALDQMRKFMVEFGMTPSSRTRVKTTEPKKAANPFVRNG